jgi:hypothetical protein
MYTASGDPQWVSLVGDGFSPNTPPASQWYATHVLNGIKWPLRGRTAAVAMAKAADYVVLVMGERALPIDTYPSTLAVYP